MAHASKGATVFGDFAVKPEEMGLAMHAQGGQVYTDLLLPQAMLQMELKIIFCFALPLCSIFWLSSMLLDSTYVSS